jgi:hypothetical protein
MAIPHRDIMRLSIDLPPRGPNDVLVDRNTYELDVTALDGRQRRILARRCEILSAWLEWQRRPQSRGMSSSRARQEFVRQTAPGVSATVLYG